MNIAICDDEKYIVDNINVIVNEYINKENVVAQIKCYYNPNELLDSLEEIDILFLDVEMPTADGFEVAKTLNVKCPNIKILFLTSHIERVQEAFKVNAFRYIYKPINEHIIIDALKEAVEEINTNSIMMIDNHIIYKNNILFIQSLGDGCVINENGENIVSKLTLKDINKSLDARFYQCHRSHIVNLSKIIAFDKKSVILKGNISIPVSVRKEAETKKAFVQYVEKYAKKI